MNNNKTYTFETIKMDFSMEYLFSNILVDANNISNVVFHSMEDIRAIQGLQYHIEGDYNFNAILNSSFNGDEPDRVPDYKQRIVYTSKHCDNVIPNPDETCVICMDQLIGATLRRKHKIVKLKVCVHKFHFKCINKWVRSNPSCPVCRKNLF